MYFFKSHVKRNMQNSNTGSYQFKITLMGVNPPIWRRIQIPKNFNMFEFASAIIDAIQYKFGIEVFRFIIEQSIIIPDVEFENEGREEIKQYFIKDFVDCEIEFEYNLDDEPFVGWMHKIEFEGEIPDILEEPRCLEGERAAPPEDVALDLRYECSVYEAYEEFMSVVMDKNHPDRDWYLYMTHLKEYDDNFDVNTVKFVKCVEKPAWVYDTSV